LDGVANGEGVIVVATANEPTLLDPAILKRPGRFDRVVNFPNPDQLRREQYFTRLQLLITAREIELIGTASGGFSFARLREAYILAGQNALSQHREITATD